MFRCSLGRVCPRRQISPSWTGTPRTYRTSPSLFLGTASSSRDQNSSSSNTAQALLNTSSKSTKPHQSYTKLHDARLGTHFLAPSARGISPGTGVKDDPHALLVRAGYIRQAHAGVFHLLPLALQVQRRVEAGLQHIMHRLDASEVSLSSISSEALWKRSGRIEQPLEGGQHEFMTIRDRKKSAFILSPTHEEEITNLVSDMTNSYKDFPLRLYQISRKYRDELRPRQGLLRTKEFMMKDLYTFDISEKAALDTYQSVRAAYRKFFEALGVPYVEVEASSGNMGGSLSHEYHFLSPLGEDTIVICESCGFAANEEILAKKAEGQDQHQCPRCTGHKISSHRAIEVGHTFHLGTRYTEPLNAFVNVPKIAQSNKKTSEELGDHGQNTTTIQDSSTDRVPLQMGCHGIGVSRLIGAVAAMTADEKGLCWPPLMAPEHVVIVFDGSTPPTNPNFPEVSNSYEYISERIGSINYNGDWGKPSSRSLDIVFDDREKPLPWKLKDADLTGYPIIIVIGKSFKETGKYEIQCRSSSKLSTTSDVLTTSVATILNELTVGNDPQKAQGKIWRLGEAAAKCLTPHQVNVWGDNLTPANITAKTNDKLVTTKARKDKSAGTATISSPMLEQDVGNKEQPLETSGREPGLRISRVPARCPECGNKHIGDCFPLCAVCGKRHVGTCRNTISRSTAIGLDLGKQATHSGSERIVLSRAPNEEAAAETSTNLGINKRNHRAQVLTDMKPERQKGRLANKNRAQQAPSDSFSDSPNWEAEEPPPHSHSNARVLSHEHLLERVTLLERLMALKAEEDMLRKQNGKG